MPAAILNVVALALLSGSAGAITLARAPATHTVTVEATAFSPATLVVKAGDTVTWVNRDPFPHTVTSTEGAFDSKVLQPDASWSFTPTVTGAFPYVCTLHPTMKGTLRVD